MTFLFELQHNSIYFEVEVVFLFFVLILVMKNNFMGQGETLKNPCC